MQCALGLPDVVLLFHFTPAVEDLIEPVGVERTGGEGPFGVGDMRVGREADVGGGGAAGEGAAS